MECKGGNSMKQLKEDHLCNNVFSVLFSISGVIIFSLIYKNQLKRNTELLHFMYYNNLSFSDIWNINNVDYSCHSLL